jgi:leucine-rich repeat protein SHOC2
MKRLNNTVLFFFLFHLSFVALNQDQSFQKNKEKIAAQMQQDMFKLAEFQQVPFTNLEHALKHKEIVFRIDLSNQNLSDFPKEVLSLKNLEVLDLSNNQIKEIPSTISKLKKLKVLTIESNNLKTLPEKISELKNLERLLIKFNQSDFNFPTSMANLQKLKELHCSNLSSFPSFIFNIRTLEKIKIWSSNLTEIPTDINKLQNLKEICFQNNYLKTLPDELFLLPYLEYLNLGGNQFSMLTNDINKLKKLDYLGLYENPINVIPLDANMFTHLRFLSIWNTTLPSNCKDNWIGLSETFTKVYLTKDGVH